MQTVQGANDPVTAALHIVLGSRVPLDLCRLQTEHKLRYAASLVAYGFFGDVIVTSDPKRYNCHDIDKLHVTCVIFVFVLSF